MPTYSMPLAVPFPQYAAPYMSQWHGPYAWSASDKTLYWRLGSDLSHRYKKQTWASGPGQGNVYWMKCTEPNNSGYGCWGAYLAGPNDRVWTSASPGTPGPYPPVPPHGWSFGQVGQDGSFQQAGAPYALGPAQIAAHYLHPWLGPFMSATGLSVWKLKGDLTHVYARGTSNQIPGLKAVGSPFPAGYVGWWRSDVNIAGDAWTLLCSAAPNARIWTCLGGPPRSGWPTPVYPPVQPHEPVPGYGGPNLPSAPPCPPGYVDSPYWAAGDPTGPRCLPLPPAVKLPGGGGPPKPNCPPGWHYDAYIEQCVKDGSPKGY